MAGKRYGWCTVLIVLLGLAMPSEALAGPFFGEWSCFWRPAPDCPCGLYSPCHYWKPELYVLRACVFKPNLDQYPPGPCPPVMPTFDYYNYRCVAIPPVLRGAYADPSAYYGRQIIPVQRQ